MTKPLFTAECFLDESRFPMIRVQRAVEVANAKAAVLQKALRMLLNKVNVVTSLWCVETDVNEQDIEELSSCEFDVEEMLKAAGIEV
jgi:hypothetical protein